MAFTAKEVQVLRQATGAGMMDCKKALEEANGDFEAAKKWLREKGLSASAKRDDRDNAQGLVSILIKGNIGAMVKLKCETDFVASSDGFKAEADALVALVVEQGEAAVSQRATQLEDLKILLKEKIELGEVVRFEAASGNIVGSYSHLQGGRGINGVLVEMSGANEELAHDVAGKPEQAIAKIVDGRVTGFYKDICLLEQPYAKDDKQSVAQIIGSAKIIRFAQVEIG